MGGSTNTVLHTLALCHEAEIDYSLERINEIAARVPHLAKIAPASDFILKMYIVQAESVPLLTNCRKNREHLTATA